MNQAVRDANGVTVNLGLLDSDGITPKNIKADSTTHKLKGNTAATGSNLSPNLAGRDDNGVTTMIALSSADGITPIALYINASDEFLIKST